MASLTLKRSIVAALLLTLAASVVITVFFIALGPARIHFSVAAAGSQPSGGGALVLNLTLLANNTSHRAAVRYDSIFVDVSNNTGDPQRNFVSAAVDPPAPLLQPRGEVRSFRASVELVDIAFADGFTANGNGAFAVVVTAQARFVVGVAPTRLYDIKLTCSPISFFHHETSNAAAAGAVVAGQPPVQCI